MVSLSRRAFGRLLGSGITAAALRPVLAKAPPPAPAPASTVRLSANENPYGPCPAAIEAMRAASGRAWRYPDEAIGELRADLARLHGLPAEWFLVGNGSSEILKLAVSAFTGPGKRLVTADPAFEAAGHYAEAGGVQVTRVPLDGAYAHPLDRMSPPDAGLVYVCNPNNPTASLTPKARLRAFIDGAPCMVLVDEAYHHYADSADYESVAPLVKTQPKLVVARTFSKIHGLAGARLGYAIAQPALIEKLGSQAAWDSVNVFAIAAGRASLSDASWAEQGRRRNAATRSHVVAELARRGFAAIPSQANFVMIETRRPVKPLISGLAERGVQVGRLFPALPTHLRVTLGTPDQMERFLTAFAALTA
jgi:histidinol-phosphate aminotransferase